MHLQAQQFDGLIYVILEGQIGIIEFCRMTQLIYKLSCIHPQCVQIHTGTRRALFWTEPHLFRRYNTIVHNGPFHEVSCDIQRFQAAANTVLQNIGEPYKT